jgi:hypothetical protein
VTKIGVKVAGILIKSQERETNHFEIDVDEGLGAMEEYVEKISLLRIVFSGWWMKKDCLSFAKYPILVIIDC